MLDTLDILITNDEDSISHHGVVGMKWGVRKKEYTSNTNHNDRFTGRNKNVTQGNGKGVHKRGRGMNVTSLSMRTGDLSLGVGGDNSYYNSIANGTGVAPVTTQLGQALYSAMYSEIRETEEYRNIQRLIEEFRKLSDSRTKYRRQGSTASTIVFEEKANKLIREINSNLSELDSKFYEKTKMVKKTAYKDFSPSKSILENLPSIGLNVDKYGRVSKGWKEYPTVSNSQTGYRF